MKVYFESIFLTEKGTEFMVVEGAHRILSLKVLVDQGMLPSNMKIRCQVIPAGFPLTQLKELGKLLFHAIL